MTAYERGFAGAPDRLLAGAILNGATGNRYATATQLIVTYAYARNDRRRSGTHFFNACNLGLSAEQFHRIGGFSEAFPLASGEDYDFCHRWRHAGLETAYLPDAVVEHHHPLTLSGFCRQHFSYGRGLYLCRRRIARRVHTPFRIEAPSFYLGLSDLSDPHGRRRRRLDVQPAASRARRSPLRREPLVNGPVRPSRRETRRMRGALRSDGGLARAIP